MPVDVVAQRLADPNVQQRMSDNQVDHYAGRLEQLLAIAEQDDSSRFEWA